MKIAIDLDGTICRGETFATSEPRPEAIARIQQHLQEGDQITILTARHARGQPLTARQLGEWLPKGVSVVMRAESWPDSDEWKVKYVDWKGRKLREMAVDLYVGDLSLDLRAAKAAGVPFKNVEEWLR